MKPRIFRSVIAFPSGLKAHGWVCRSESHWQWGVTPLKAYQSWAAPQWQPLNTP